MAESAKQIIERLGLQPHPEGGWYRETWRAPAGEGERAAGTAIHFLLEANQASHWHRVDAHEVWLWHQGDPLELMIAPSGDGPVDTVRLCKDDALQCVVPAYYWQAARPASDEHGYVLVSCIVAPGFEFDGFELAPEGWAPGTSSS